MTDHRPRFHFTAPQGWLNDPNGVIRWQGRWHLHYQHNPQGPRWGQIHWGHASSEDLLTWRDEPIALAPSPGVDQDGCFSGSIAIVDGTPTLYYTGFRDGLQVQCLATSPDLRQWTKQPALTIGDPPPGVGRTDFRDPFVFRVAGQWYMVVGASLRSERGQVLLYRSDDGLHWTYRHALYTATDLGQGVLWECPNFFPLGDRWVLTVSVWPNLAALWFVGRFEDERFVPQTQGVLDPDGGAFAHLVAPTDDGRWLQWAWMAEQRAQSAVDADGWAGALTVPRELGIDAQGRLLQRPAREVAQLRREPVPVRATGAVRGETHRFQGDVLDLEARFTLRDRQKVGLVVAASADATERTRLYFWPDARRLVIDRSMSSTDPGASRQQVWALHEHVDGEPLRLRVLLDRSVLQVYADERTCLSTRIYPAGAGSVHGSVFVEGEGAAEVQAWTLRGILPERGRGAGTRDPSA